MLLKRKNTHTTTCRTVKNVVRRQNVKTQILKSFEIRRKRVKRSGGSSSQLVVIQIEQLFAVVRRFRSDKEIVMFRHFVEGKYVVLIVVRSGE